MLPSLYVIVSKSCIISKTFRIICLLHADSGSTCLIILISLMQNVAPSTVYSKYTYTLPICTVQGTFCLSNCVRSTMQFRTNSIEFAMVSILRYCIWSTSLQQKLVNTQTDVLKQLKACLQMTFTNWWVLCPDLSGSVNRAQAVFGECDRHEYWQKKNLKQSELSPNTSSSRVPTPNPEPILEQLLQELIAKTTLSSEIIHLNLKILSKPTANEDLLLTHIKNNTVLYIIWYQFLC